MSSCKDRKTACISIQAYLKPSKNKIMYKRVKHAKTSIRVNNAYKAESIEAKVRRIVSNKEPITDGAPMIYTERKDGVAPSYNIRTDRFESAVEAMDGVSRAHLAKREANAAKLIEMNPKKDGGAEPIQGTDTTA